MEMADGGKPGYRKIDEVRVGDIFQVVCGKAVTVRADQSLHDAVRVLLERPEPNSRKLYVVDGQGRLAGIVTLETIMRHIGYYYSVRKPGVMSFFQFLREILKGSAGEIMQKEPARVTKEDRVLDALKLMVEHHVNDLPVVDEGGAVVGELNGLEVLRRAAAK